MSEKIRIPGRQSRHDDNVAQSSHHTADPAAGNGVTGACPEPAATTFRPANLAGPLASQEVSPLAWWRTFPADMFADAEQLLLAAILDTIGVMDRHKGLAAALRGDAATAVQVALSLLPLGEITLRIDIAMTAVLRCALDGDLNAALVLAHLLGRSELDADELAASWFSHHRRAARGRYAYTRQEAALLSKLRDHGSARRGGAA